METNKLPVDVWWKIITLNWDTSWENHDKNNPMISKHFYHNIYKIGKSITSDLLIFRKICKTTKHVVEKYTKRYKSDFGPNYRIVFKYGKSI